MKAINDLCETLGWFALWPVEMTLTRRWLSLDAFLIENGWQPLGGGLYLRW
jgi:hypothetical protein